MTKPACAVDHRSMPAADLKKTLADLLAGGPLVTHDIARATGYSVTCVRRHLTTMEQGGKVYHQHVTTKYGFSHRWHVGPEPEVVLPDEDDACPLRQVVTRQYPRIGRRDPLVAALFGMAAAGPALVPRAPTSLLELER